MFKCNLVIQMTDDEKYLWKNLTLDELHTTLRENVRDIIAMGFDRERTFIFNNLDYVGGQFYRNIVQLEKRMTGNQVGPAPHLSFQYHPPIVDTVCDSLLCFVPILTIETFDVKPSLAYACVLLW